MKDNYLQIILVLAIFIIPEILKLFKSKKKKYEYPDEQQRYEYDQEQADTGYSKSEQEQLPTDFWDILTGNTNYQEPSKQESVELEAPVPETERPRKELTQAATITKGTAKLSAKAAAKGLIWAEVLGKPRALRPIGRELPCRRSYR